MKTKYCKCFKCVSIEPETVCMSREPAFTPFFCGVRVAHS